MRKSKILGLNLPEKNGTDVADIDVITADLEALEDNLARYEYLADKFGWSYTKTTPGGVLTYTFRVSDASPVTATKVITRAPDSGGNKIYNFVTTIGEVTESKKMTAGATTATMEVL